jgi:NitT/TauT family transport system substrate-binding protein
MMKWTVLALLLVFFWPIHYGHSQEKIRIGYSSVSVHSIPVWIAEKRGIYAKYGSSSLLIFIPGGSTNVQALVSGSVDLAQLTAPPGVAANLEGSDIVYIAGIDDRMAYQLVTRPEIKSPAQLRGAKLGISRFGSSSDFGTRLLVKKLGLDPSRDITILQIGTEMARIAALKSGGIDGTVVNAPYGTQAERQKFNVLADAGKMGIVYFNTGICGSSKFLSRQEGKVLNFMRAYLEAIKIFKTERDYSVKALSQFTRVDDLKIVEEAYTYFRDRVPNVPYPSLEAMKAVVSQMGEENPKASKADARSYISDRFLKRLEEEGFIKRLWAR